MNLAVQNVESMTKQSSGGSRRMYWERMRVPVSQIINTPAMKEAMLEWTSSQTVRYDNGTTTRPMIAHTWQRGKKAGKGESQTLHQSIINTVHSTTSLVHSGKHWLSTRRSERKTTYHSHANIRVLSILLSRLLELKWPIIACQDTCYCNDQLGKERRNRSHTVQITSKCA